MNQWKLMITALRQFKTKVPFSKMDTFKSAALTKLVIPEEIEERALKNHL